MKHILFLFLILPSMISAQETALYTRNGSLKVKPDLFVDSTRLKDIKIIESYYLPYLFNHLYYPKEYSDNGITGLSILKLTIKFKEKNSECGMVKKIAQLDSVIITRAYEETKEILFNIECIKNKNDLTFYLPIRFEIDDEYTLEKMLTKNKAIFIQAVPEVRCSVLGEITKVKN